MSSSNSTMRFQRLLLLLLSLVLPHLTSSENTTETTPVLSQRPLPNNDTSEVDESEPKNAGGVHDEAAAAPVTRQLIEFGKNCDPGNPEACQHFPNVTCVTDSHRISTCRCIFFRTWLPEDQICFLNVFSPCSKGVPGVPDLACGENAFCANDTLNINKVKFCRCHKGFMPKLNQDTIPAFCVPDYNNPDGADEPVDYEHDAAVHQSQPSILHLPTCFAALLLTLLK